MENVESFYTLDGTRMLYLYYQLLLCVSDGQEDLFSRTCSSNGNEKLVIHFQQELSHGTQSHRFTTVLWALKIMFSWR